MKLRYSGPHDAVDVVLPDGSTVEVARGASADFDKETAESLLEQEGIWKKDARKGPGKGE